MIQHQVAGLRQHIRYKHSVIFVIIEANMSYITADGIREFLERRCPDEYAIDVQPMVVVNDFDSSGKGRVGVITGDVEKELYAEELAAIMKDGCLCIAQDFIKPHAEETEQVLSALYEQLSNYMLDVKIAQDRVFGEAKRKYTGKVGGAFDDLSMLAQMLNFWGKKTMRTDAFRKKCHRLGWVTQ